MDGPAQYKGIRHCLQTSIAKEGYGFLTRGLGTTVIRAFPTNAATFAVVSLVMDFFKENETEVVDVWEEFKKSGEILIQSAKPQELKLQYSPDLEKRNLLNSYVLYSIPDSKTLFAEINKLSNDNGNLLSVGETEKTEETEEDRENKENQKNCNHQTNRFNTSPLKWTTIVTHQSGIEGSFCKVCGQYIRRGAKFIFNTSNSLKCLTLRHQTLSNSL